MRLLLLILILVPMLSFGQQLGLGLSVSKKNTQTESATIVVDYCAEADALFARITSWDSLADQRELSVKSTINNSIVRLKNNGIWDSLDIFYNYFLWDTISSNANWTHAGHTITSHGSIVLTKWQYYAGNTGYLHSHFNPYSEAEHYTRNNAEVGIYMNVLPTGAITSTSFSAATTYMLPIFGASPYFAINTGTPESSLGLSDTGFLALKRSNATNQIILINSTSASGLANSSALSSNEFYLFSFSPGLQASNEKSSMFFAGGSLTDAQNDSIISIYRHLYYTLTDDKKIGVVGNSTISTYGGAPSISSLMDDYNYTITDVAVAGHTINEQLTAWEAADASAKTALEYVFVEIGLNDCNPATATATTLAQYQVLVDSIADDSPTAKIVLCTMTPAKERFVDLGWGANGYQKWLDMNTAIMGGGASPITGADYRLNAHTAALNDGSGNLDAEYDTGDHIHENAAARHIIGNVWESVIN